MKKIVSVVLCFTLVSLFAGCATIMEEHPGAAVGTGAGAATGAVAGALIGKGAGAAVVGGLIGGLLGGAIGHYAYDAPRSRAETARVYDYSPSQGTVLTIEDEYAAPNVAHPGDVVDLKLTYAVLTPSSEGEISVTEIREITHNGELVGQPEVRVERAGGTYTSTVPLHLPPDAPRGRYQLTSMVQSRYAKDSRVTYFTVR